MYKVKLFIIGFIIGLGKIIPGVSGAIFAILFGVYYDIVNFLSNPFKYKNLLGKIVPLMVGIIFAIITGSNIIKLLLYYRYSYCMFFFLGLMTYGLVPLLPDLKRTSKSIKDYILSSIVLIFIMVLLLVPFKSGIGGLDYGFRKFISLVICGVLDAISSIVPGISGTAILMILGYYEVIITNLSYLGSSSTFIMGFITLIPFIIGFILGIVLVSKLIKYLLDNYVSLSKLCILGFYLISIFMILTNILRVSTIDIVSIILLIIGFITSYIVDTIFKV